MSLRVSRRPIRRPLAAGAGAILLAAALGCNRSPVATLKVEPAKVRLDPGRSVPLRVEWMPRSAIDLPPDRVFVFAHLRDGRGTVLRTFDHPLPLSWAPGTPMAYEVDLYESVLVDPLAPGDYSLTMGLYDVELGYRWPLEVPGEEGEEREYRVAAVEAAPPGAPNPRFLFAGDWSTPEAYPDQQTIRLRWLLGSASIHVREIPAPGVVRMRVKVERPPGIEVRSTCEPGRVVRMARGSHWIGIETQAAGECEIHFGPAEPGTSFSAPSARLEVVAWRPKGG